LEPLTRERRKSGAVSSGTSVGETEKVTALKFFHAVPFVLLVAGILERKLKIVKEGRQSDGNRIVIEISSF
jgi:hypothetical protein